MMIWILEFKKMFFSKKIIFLVIAFLFVNAFKIYQSNEFSPKSIESHNLYNVENFLETEKEINGVIDIEKSQKVYDGYNAHIKFLQSGNGYSQENYCYYLMYEKYFYQYEYHLTMNKLVEEAKSNAVFFNNKKNSYLMKKNNLFEKYYSNRYISNFYNNDDFDILFSYNFSSFIMVIIAFILSLRVFYYENEIGMDNLLYTSIKGRKKIAIVKLSAYILLMTLISLLFFFQDVIIHSYMFRLNSWTSPVYSIESYKFSPFSGSIIMYYLNLCFRKSITSICIGLIFIFITTIIKNKILPIIINVSIISFLILMSEVDFTNDLIQLLNPVYYFKINKICKYFDVIDILGHPLLKVNIILTLSIVLILVLLFAICYCYRFRLTINTINQRCRKC